MADIASSDVTITVEDRRIETKKRINRVKIEFGDGALTYPAGGVPLPTFGSFGMKRNIDFVNLYDAASGDGLVYKYDVTNHKVRIYEGDYAQVGDAELAELDAASDTPAATDLYGEAVGW